MKCTITENAAMRLNYILEQQENKELRFRVLVSQAFGPIVHYGLSLDVQQKNDELVNTDSGIQVLMDKNNRFLDGVIIDYNPSQDKWLVHNSDQGQEGTN